MSFGKGLNFGKALKTLMFFVGMATETDYVPSVSPANIDDANIQRGTPELMCISPDSDNSPEQISGNSTLDLLRQQEWLLAKKQDLEIQLLARGQGCENINSLPDNYFVFSPL